MNDKMEELLSLLTSMNKNLEIVSKNITALRSADSIRNLALSNFVKEQSGVNDSHSSSINSLVRCLDSWFEAEGKLKKIIKN